MIQFNLYFICFMMGFMIDKISLFPFSLGIIFGSIIQYKFNYMKVPCSFLFPYLSTNIFGNKTDGKEDESTQHIESNDK